MRNQEKQSIIMAGVILGMMGAIMFGYSLRKVPATPQQATSSRQNFRLVNPDMAKESWLERGQRSLDELSRTVRDIEGRLKIMESQGSGTGAVSAPVAPGGYAPGSPQEREARLKQDLAKLGVTPVVKGGDLYPPSPVPPAVTGEVKPKPFTPEELGISRTPPPQPQAAEAARQVQPVTGQSRNIMGIFDFTKKKIEVAPESPPDPSSIGKDGTNYAETENFYTPGGSFFKVSLLTGLDAPSGPSSKSQPHPLLLRIQDLSWLPNELRQNVTGCFVMCEGYGDLSTERAFIRRLNISCVNKENRNVLDEALVGYVTDTDGKLGLRGRVVSKQGAYLARALIAGFIEGVAKGFDTSVSTTVVTGGGVVTTDEIEGFSDGFKKGMSSGISKAAKELSDFYLEGAEQLYPVIEINALRHATFIITEGKRFSFNKVIQIPRNKITSMAIEDEHL
jgi:conjugal transfer pilus assembly protein TraB